MKKSLFLSTLIAATALSFSALPAWALDGEGTESSPYYGTIQGTEIFSTEDTTTVYIGTATEALGGNGTNSYFAGHSSNTSYYVSNLVINAGGIYVTNGNGGDYHYYSGTITGTGDWTVTWSTTGTTTNDDVTQRYAFIGDLSGWSGNLTIYTVNTSDYVYYGNGNVAATNTNVSGNGGSIAVNFGTVQYNYTGYAEGTSATALTVTNSSIEANKVTFIGSVNYEVSSTVKGWDGTENNRNGVAVTASNSTLTVSNTGTTTFSGKVSNFDNVTVGGSSTLAIASTGSLDISGTAVNLGTAIQNSGTVTIDTSTSFVLDNIAYTGDWTSDSGATYTLITNVGSGTIYIGSDILTSDNVSSLTINNVSSSVTITDASFSFVDGTLSVTVKGSTSPVGSTASNPYTGTITDFDLSTWAAGSTVYINGVTTGSYFVNSSSNAVAIVANIDISGDGMVLSNAYSDVIYTFSGKITGDGNWTFTGGSSTPIQHYIFTGDLSEYSGDFSLTAGTSARAEGYIQFGDGGQAATNTNVSGTGSITEATTGQGFAVIYNYGSLADGDETAITIGNKSITTPDLQFAGSVDYIVSSTVAGSSGALTVSNAGTTTFSGEVSGFSTIAVNEGSTLAIASGGSLDLSGTTVTLASAISNSGTITVSESTSFVIDGITMGTTSEGNDYYVLITGADGASLSGTIDISAFSGVELTGTWSVYTENGYLVIYGEAQTVEGKTDDNLVWAGTTTDYTWNADSSTNTVWQNADGDTGYYFTDGNNVTFGAEGANTTVAVEGEVTAGSTTINGAYTFNIAEDASVTTGALTIADGGSLALTGSGKIVTQAATNANTGAIAFDARNFTGEMDFTKGFLDIANSTFNSEATVVVTAETTETDSNTGVLTSTNVSLFVGNAESNSTSEFAASLVLEGEGGVMIRTGTSDKNVTFSGSVTGTNARLQLNGGGNATFTNTVNVSTYTNYQGATTFTNATTLGTLEIYKTDANAGDVTFTGSNAQATVTDLVVAQAGGSDAATLTVSSGASLSVETMTVNHDFAITIDNATMSITSTVTQASSTSTSVTISNGGTLELGSGVSLNVAAMEIILGTSDIASTNGVSPTADGTAILTGSGTLTSDAAIAITVDEALASVLGTEGTYTFDIYSGLSLDENVFDIEDILKYGTATWTDGVLTVVVGSGEIPEPSMFGVIFGLGAIGLVATRRRRRKVA